MTGTVYLIGAGPGDPGLFTLRGKEILGRCDVVVHDYLANSFLLSFARPDAELIYAGKRGGDHTLPQADINRLLIARAGEGKTVARLKGGDPYMFGRGSEEAEELAKAGIAFEVVPGVTSAIAAPAYAGISLTHRAHASSVCFVTGHENPDKTESAHNWKALATGNHTLVFFMGMKNLPEIVHKLVDNGMNPRTPAALVYRGTTPDHRSAAAALCDLPRVAEEQNFGAPSLIVVGHVVTMRDTLGWFEKKPLLGKGVVVTRSREQASGLAALLTDAGARVVEFPSIAIGPLDDCAPVREAICTLREYDWVVFTSVNGVDFFWRELAALGLDSRAFAACRVAAIGPATAQSLEARGIRPDFVPQSFVAEGVLAGLAAQNVHGRKILIPRAREARDVLPQGLAAAGADVRVLPVYAATASDAGRDEVLELLAQGKIHYVTFASSSTVSNFLQQIPVEILRRHPGLRFACIGPVTAGTLADAGLDCHIQPEAFTIPALVEALSAHAGTAEKARP